MQEAAQQPAPADALTAQVAALQAALAESRAQVDQLSRENDQLRASHERLRQQLELLRRRIFIAKAERVDSSQLELEFATKLAAYDVLSGQLANGSTLATGSGASPCTSAAPKGLPIGRTTPRFMWPPRDGGRAADTGNIGATEAVCAASVVSD